MNSSTGWLFCSAPRAVLERRAGDAAGSSGSLRVASTRSLSGPGWRTSVARSAIVGLASCTSGRSSRRNGARSLVAGLDVGDQRVEVVERRAQVHERRCCRAAASSAAAPAPRSSARFSAAIAPVGGVRVADQRGRGRRACSAIAVTVREELTMKSRQRALVLRSTSLTSRRALESSGLKYFVASRGLRRPCRRSWVAKPLITPCRSLRAFGSSVLKSWSRSTAVVVCDVSSVAPSGERRGSRPGRARARRSGWRCPTATSAGSPPACPRAAARRAPRRSTLIAAWLFVGELDRLAPCRPPAADLDVVALHQLAGVLEDQRVLVPARRAAANR